jgi:hypothetical protein
VVTTFDLFLIGAIVIPLPFAIRSTYHLWQTWRQQLGGRSRLLGAFFTVALVATVTATWVGFLVVRRLVGFDALPGANVVTALLAVVVFQAPMFLDWITRNVSRDPKSPDNIGRS